MILSWIGRLRVLGRGIIRWSGGSLTVAQTAALGGTGSAGPLLTVSSSAVGAALSGTLTTQPGST